MTIPAHVELAQSLANVNPDRRFATEPSCSVVGVWSDEAGRYIGVASLTITGQWVLTPEGMPYAVRQYLMSGGPDSDLATPKVLNWLSQFYAKMILVPDDAAARESVRLLEMAHAKENTRLVVPVGLSQVEVAT